MVRGALGPSTADVSILEAEKPRPERWPWIPLHVPGPFPRKGQAQRLLREPQHQSWPLLYLRPSASIAVVFVEVAE